MLNREMRVSQLKLLMLSTYGPISRGGDAFYSSTQL